MTQSLTTEQERQVGTFQPRHLFGQDRPDNGSQNRIMGTLGELHIDVPGTKCITLVQLC